MKIYENVVIGNFLYALGWSIRGKHRGGPLPSVINLLQQTPSDQLLGDLLLEFPGAMRLLEFKTEDNKSKKELARHQALSVGIEAQPHLKEISRRVHWYIESGLDSKNKFVARVAPYLEAFPRKPPTNRLEDFIEALAAEIVDGSHNKNNRNDEIEYLHWVKLLQGEGEIGSGGLLVVADTNGSLHYAQVVDMIELRMPHREWIALQEQRLQFHMRHENVRSPEREQKIERKYEGPQR